MITNPGIISFNHYRGLECPLGIFIYFHHMNDLTKQEIKYSSTCNA